MSTDGYLPPGCTQRECDEAQPGYWDEPEEDEPPEPEEPVFLETCPGCDGSGVRAYRITVYELGCGFPHDDTAEEPCPACGGTGVMFVDNGQPLDEFDLEERAPPVGEAQSGGL